MGGPGMGGPGMGGPGKGMGGENGSGSGDGGFGTGGTRTAGKPILDPEGNPIPPDFPAPRCDFVVQFAWQPRFDDEGGAKAGGLPPEDAPAESDAVPEAPAEGSVADGTVSAG